MTKVEANQILDRVKNGIPTSSIQITEALITTGDIGVNEANRGSKNETSIYQRTPITTPLERIV